MIRLLFFCAAIIVCNAVIGQHMMGRTTGKLPYMEFGPGDDRLGGAKSTYLDSNIQVVIIDSTKEDYIVQLSKLHRSFIPKKNIILDSSLRKRNYYLTSNARVYGDSLFDYVAIGMEAKLPYTSIQHINPAEIIVDVYGATTNTNWLIQLLTAKNIKHVWYEQREDDVMRWHIQLKHNAHWGYQLYYEGNKLVLLVKRPPSKLALQNIVVAIDAGHGGANTGARGVQSKIFEKEMTLLYSKLLAAELRKRKVKVIETRHHDTDITMPDRALMLRDTNPTILLSMHMNSAASDTVSGTSTYYRYLGFKPLTTAILQRMLQLGFKNYGNIGHFNFALSGPTEYPNCLVEVGFISNVQEEKKILDPYFQKLVCKQIISGLEDWLSQMPSLPPIEKPLPQLPTTAPQKIKKGKAKTTKKM
jgi:N-acetylmuramoyl-L-alanine amidase